MGKLLRVLLVEDSEDDAALLLRELRRGDYEVEFERVETAGAMQAALAQKTWDLILSDYSLPEFNAPQALEVMKASHLDLPFIILSGTIGEEVAVAALKAGANDFLVKGKFARLGPAIERELREAEVRREQRRAEDEIESLAKFPYEDISPVLRFARDGRLLYANPASADLLKAWGCEIGERPPDEIQLIVYKSLTMAPSQEIEVVHGDTIDALMFVPIVDKDYVNVYGRDITHRKRAEAALRESEERFSKAFYESPVGIALTDLSDLTIREANEALLKIIGLKREQIIGQDALKLDIQVDSKVQAEIKQELLEFGIFRNKEIQPLLPSGEIRYVLVSGTLLNLGEKPHVLALLEDITERKRAEEKIEHQLQRLNALRAIDMAISSSFDIRVTLDIVLQQVLSQLSVDAAAILLLNPQMQTIEYAASRGFRSNTFEHTQSKLMEGYAGRVIREHQTIHIPSLLKAGGELAEAMQLAGEDFVDYCGTPLIAKGEIKGVLEIYQRSALQPDPEWLDFLETLAGEATIAIDNSQLFDGLQRANAELEQRVAQRTEELNQTNLELERANRTKDEFLATMSHELRTPLNSILGLSETLLEQRRGPLSEYQQRALRTIASSGVHLLELINDILDLSKIEAGKFDHHPQLIGVNDLCQSSLTFVKELATRKSITLTYQQATTVSEMYADPRRIKQILINLLTNAVKFTPEHGQVILQVAADVEQERIQFSVTDSGIGIAPENLHKLFQPFVQVDSRLTREYEGTGLGLALVQKLTDLHGGSVNVESEVGKGSRFTINLPLGHAMPDQLPVHASDSKLPISEQLGKNSTSISKPAERAVILLAEDNMANILTIGDYLESHGYQVVVAHDGLDAIKKAEALQPNLILMDIQMPVLNGLETISRLRADPRFASTPIIALTALAMPGDRERCLVAGANEYMSKPVSLKALIKIMEAMLKF